MFWWRKRSEGFEWREYVRTTILVRREERRQRIKDAQGAAAAHVKDAGRRGVEAAVAGSRAAASGSLWSLKRAGASFARGMRWSGNAAAGSIRRVAPAAVHAGSATVGALLTAAGALIAGTTALATLISRAASRATKPIAPVLEPVLSFVRRPRPSLVLKLIAGLAGFGAAYRTWAFGFDSDAKVAAFVSLASAILLALAALTDPDRGRRGRNGLLSRLNEYEVLFPSGRRFSLGTATLAILALVGISAAGVAAIGSWSGAPSRPAATDIASLPLPKKKSDASDATATITSRRARALTGDTLKLGTAVIALDGIEAPDAAQSCEGEDGAWQCGEAARAALDGLVRGRSVSCEITGEREHGVKTGQCATGETDLAERLAEQGMAFSTGFFFWNHYSRLERKARDEKKGIWAGEADRPQDWRDKRWAEAKEKAPDGCPIKGRVRSGARIYVLPWSETYDSVRLRPARGERWFCSESEAEQAGWRRAEPS